MVEFCLPEFRNTSKTEQILGKFQKNIVIFFVLKNTTEINIFINMVFINMVFINMACLFYMSSALS